MVAFLARRPVTLRHASTTVGPTEARVNGLDGLPAVRACAIGPDACRVGGSGAADSLRASDATKANPLASPEVAPLLASLQFGDDGLIPAVVQDHDTREVLMVAWMDVDAVTATLEEGRTVFWSRSRQELWRKGETSGHVQHVRDLRVDCDADVLLVEVAQDGVACHTGESSCFHRRPADLGASS